MIFTTEEEQEQWRPFDKQDIVAHSQMNNLNDPQEWNIHFEKKGGGGGDGGGGGGGGRWGGDGNRWNYALLVPLLSLAAFRWVWSRESRREVEEVSSSYRDSLQELRVAVDRQYRQTVTDSRRESVAVQLELEREKNRAQGYRQAMASQTQQAMEVRERLREERQDLERDQAHGGAAGSLLHAALQREEASQWHRGAQATLRELEEGLVDRQQAYCSMLVPRRRRLEMEQELLLRVGRVQGERREGGERSGGEDEKKERERLRGDQRTRKGEGEQGGRGEERKGGPSPLVRLGADMEAGLRDVFQNDCHCAQYLNTDRRRNGSLMWVYLRYWQQQVTLERHRRAEDALLGLGETQEG